MWFGTVRLCGDDTLQDVVPHNWQGGVLWVWMLCLTSGQTGCCTLPPTPFDFPGAPQGHRGPLQGAVDSHPVDEEALVFHAPSPGPQSTLGPTGQGGRPLTGGGPDLASQTCSSAALGMAPTQSLSQRLDEAVLRTKGHAQDPSTHANYNQKWRVFLTWCRPCMSTPHLTSPPFSLVSLGLREGC